MEGYRKGGQRDHKRSGSRRDFGGQGGYSGGYGGGHSRGPRRDFGAPRQMHKAVCAECGQECEVPFKPAEGRPVFCKECYRNKRG